MVVMARYRKLPVEVEAHEWWKNGDHPEDDTKGSDTEGRVVRYFRRPEPEYEGARAHEGCGRIWHEHGWIDTLEGGHTVCPGDWVVTGVQGERYPVKPAIFRATYEAVDRVGTPAAALVEIFEKGAATDGTTGGSLVIPDQVRINGTPLLVPKDHAVTIHEMKLRDCDAVCVTMTLFARRVVIAAEKDLPRDRTGSF
jgi:hypothetical protein